jgi:UDPglucose 6-dehydrogenase
VPTSRAAKPLLGEKCFSSVHACRRRLVSCLAARVAGEVRAVRISVFGTGYLGATHAAALARWGHDVVGIDVDRQRAERLSRGEPPFHEPDFAELLVDGVRSGRLSFTTDPTAAARADVHFLCVGTPQLEDGHGADLSALWAAVEALAPVARPGSVVVGKSTVPVGTAALVQQRLDDLTGLPGRAEVAWNPEFLREGHAVEDSLHPSRLVLGVSSGRAQRRLREVYAPVVADGVAVVATDLQTAELAKASANVMLASRISLVNVLAEVCEAAGADIEGLTEILGLDPRIGGHYLSPGLGFGGGCLPKDLRAFAARASELGVGSASGLLAAVDEVNLHQRRRTVELATGLLDGRPRGRRVAALGAAFKGDSDDLRDSPALAVALAVADRGAQVRVYDPQASRSAVESLGLEVAADLESACAGAELTMVLTDWSEFAQIDPLALGTVVDRRTALDARLVLDPDRWSLAGWHLHALGRGDGEPSAEASVTGPSRAALRVG